MQTRNYLVVAAAVGVAILFLGTTKTGASEQPAKPVDPANRLIRVSGTAVVYGKPDYATIELGVTKLSPRVGEAKSACDLSMAKVQDAIRKAGVAQADIQTVNFQIFPVQPSGKPNAIRQWKVAHYISVKVRKVNAVAAILDAAVGSGATDVSQVTYSLEKIIDLRSKARTEAARVAREKAEELARLNNVQLGDPITISDSSGGYYPAQSVANSSMDNAFVASSYPNVMSGGQIAVDAREDVEFAIR